jgi:hypothetical protein
MYVLSDVTGRGRETPQPHLLAASPVVQPVTAKAQLRSE